VDRLPAPDPKSHPKAIAGRKLRIQQVRGNGEGAATLPCRSLEFEIVSSSPPIRTWQNVAVELGMQGKAKRGCWGLLM